MHLPDLSVVGAWRRPEHGRGRVHTRRHRHRVLGCGRRVPQGLRRTAALGEGPGKRPGAGARVASHRPAGMGSVGRPGRATSARCPFGPGQEDPLPYPAPFLRLDPRCHALALSLSLCRSVMGRLQRLSSAFRPPGACQVRGCSTHRRARSRLERPLTVLHPLIEVDRGQGRRIILGKVQHIRLCPGPRNTLAVIRAAPAAVVVLVPEAGEAGGACTRRYGGKSFGRLPTSHRCRPRSGPRPVSRGGNSPPDGRPGPPATPAPATTPAPPATLPRSCPTRKTGHGPAGPQHSRTCARGSHTAGTAHWTRQVRARKTVTTGPPGTARLGSQPRATKRPFLHAPTTRRSPEQEPCSTHRAC